MNDTINTKICAVCTLEKELDYYYEGRNQCKKCVIGMRKPEWVPDNLKCTREQLDEQILLKRKRKVKTTKKESKKTLKENIKADNIQTTTVINNVKVETKNTDRVFTEPKTYDMSIPSDMKEYTGKPAEYDITRDDVSSEEDNQKYSYIDSSDDLSKNPLFTQLDESIANISDAMTENSNSFLKYKKQMELKFKKQEEMILDLQKSMEILENALKQNRQD